MTTKTETEHNIERMEEIGRYNYEKLCQLHDPSIKCVRTGITDSWDIEQTGPKGDFIVEVKVREDYGINDFVDLYIDKIKIDALRERARKTGQTPILVCFYPKDDEVVMWNVLNKYELKKKWVNKCTVASRTDKVLKNVYSLLISRGKRLKYNFYWEETQNDTANSKVER